MTAKKRVASGVVTDDFWARVEPWVPVRERLAGVEYTRKAGGGRKPKSARLVFEAWYMCCEPVASGKHCRRSASAVPARSTSDFWNGSVPVCLKRSGRRGWRNMTRWKASPGAGKVSRGPWSRLHWHKSRSGPTRLTGEKKWEQASSAGPRPWRPLVVHRDRSESA